MISNDKEKILKVDINYEKVIIRLVVYFLLKMIKVIVIFKVVSVKF